MISGRCRLRGALLAGVAATLLAGRALAGDGAAYVEAYNTVALMIRSRCDAVRVPYGAVAVKDPRDPSQNAVSSADVGVLRDKTRELMLYYLDPQPFALGPCTINEAVTYDAFPTMRGRLGDSFLLVPGRYTDSGNDVRVSNFFGNFSDIPVLIEHFQDLRQLLLDMRRTRAPCAYVPSAGGNERSVGSGLQSTVEAAKAAAAAGLPNATLRTTLTPPCLYTRCGRDVNGAGDLYGADIVGIGQQVAVSGLPAACIGVVTFYAYARAIHTADLSGFTNPTLVWDDYGHRSLHENMWTVVGTAPLVGGAALSGLIGPKASELTGVSEWCAAPGDPRAYGKTASLSMRGFDVPVVAPIVEWTGLYQGDITVPRETDSGDDGLVFAGCGCASGCERNADPAWRDMEANPGCRFPLGVSSAAEGGGVQVQAYLAESYSGRESRQQLSLDTYSRIWESGAGGFGFALVRRPSGAEVLFSLKGTSAGQPVNGGNAYHLELRDGAWELVFDNQTRVVHRFNGSGASGIVGAREVGEVRVTRENHEVTLARTVTKAGTHTTVRWPGLQIDRVRRNEGVITCVYCDAHGYAEPSYGGGQITSVYYSDTAYRPLGRMNMAAPATPAAADAIAAVSVPRARGAAPALTRVALDPDRDGRVFRLVDAAGAPRDRVQIAVDLNHAAIWRHGAQESAAQLDTVDVTEGPDGRRVARRARVLNPGMADAHSNVSETVLAPFAWGREVVEERRGAEGPAPLVTTYAYGEDPADTNQYGRRTLVVHPDGGWTRTVYDALGRVSRRAEPVGDAAPDAPAARCRETLFVYAGDAALAGLRFPAQDVAPARDARPRIEIEFVGGHEVARTYTAYLPDRMETRRCVQPGAAYDDPSNRVAVRKRLTTGTFAGRPAVVMGEDGMVTRYAYALNTTRHQLTTTVDRGEGSESAVTNGTRTVTVTDAAERVLVESTTDIASGITLADRTIDRDGLGRATNEVNRLDGGRTTREYGCCGVEREVDADGVETRTDYTPLKQVLATTRAGVTHFNTYDSWGNVVRTWQRGADGVGGGWSWSGYDDAGRLASSTNADGTTVTQREERSAAGGRVVTLVQADGGTRVERYGRDGRLQSVGGSAVAPACFVYGAAPGETWTVEYRGVDTNATEWVKTVQDMLGRERRVEYADGYGVEMEYDAADREVRRRDGYTTTLAAYGGVRGDVQRQAVDMDGDGAIGLAGADRITETRTGHARLAGRDTRWWETRVYAQAGAADTVVTATGGTTLDGSESWSAAFGRTSRVVTVRERASARRTETRTEADGTRRVAVYTNGLLVSEERVAADGRVVARRTQRYDGLQRLVETGETAANGETRTTSLAYDAAGRVTSTVERAGSLWREQRQEFDAMGRVACTHLADGGVVEYGYDARGALAWQRGARTYPVAYAYDEQGRLATMSTYRDGPGGAADTTRWEYDPRRGWLSAKRYADGSAVTFATRPDGARGGRTWARGVRTTYDLDPAGAVTNVAYSDGTPSVAMRYDRQGRLVEVRDAVGCSTRHYAADGLLLSETLPPQPGLALAHAYDAWGRCTNTALRTSDGSDPSDGSDWFFSYDGAGRVRRVSGGAVAATYDYGADGTTVTNTALGGGLHTARRLDGFGRLLEIATGDDTRTAWRSRYAYNAADQRVRQEQTAGGEDAYWLYGYDELGQLTSGRQYFADGVPVGGAQFEYRYDTIGNRTETRNLHGQQTRASAYEANALNQYVQRSVPGEVFLAGSARADADVRATREPGAPPMLANRHGAYWWFAMPLDNRTALAAATNLSVTATLTTVEGGVTSSLMRAEQRTAVVPQTPERFAYDADGNLLADGQWTYTWDAENRLAAMQSRVPDVPAAMRRRLEFAYDHQGRRVRKIVSRWDAATGGYVPSATHTFVWDGWLLLSETIRTPQSETRNSYTWGLDLSGSLGGAGGIGGLLAITRHPTGLTLRVAHDGSGNVMSLLDTNNLTTAEYQYGPFGEELKTTGEEAAGNPWRFSGRYADQESGVVMYPKRPYSASMGRFMARDGIGEAGGLNVYAFVRNAPPNGVDALGLALYAFDGTGNTPSDRTNVRLLWEAYTGTSKHYSIGVGTMWRGPLDNPIIGGLNGAGGNSRVERAYDDFVTYFTAGDHDVDIIGFSRGAALALDFANTIYERGDPRSYSPGRWETERTHRGQRRHYIPGQKGCDVEIRFIGLFDTVASFGVPGNDLNFGVSLALPPNVGRAAHAIARDEKRILFPLTRVAGATESVFSGDHSDIGGGWSDRRILSRYPLDFIADQGRDVGVPFGSIGYPSYTMDETPHDLSQWMPYMTISRMFHPLRNPAAARQNIPMQY